MKGTPKTAEASAPKGKRTSFYSDPGAAYLEGLKKAELVDLAIDLLRQISGECDEEISEEQAKEASAAILGARKRLRWREGK